MVRVWERPLRGGVKGCSSFQSAGRASGRASQGPPPGNPSAGAGGHGVNAFLGHMFSGMPQQTPQGLPCRPPHTGVPGSRAFPAEGPRHEQERSGSVNWPLPLRGVPSRAETRVLSSAHAAEQRSLGQAGSTGSLLSIVRT